MRLPTGIGMEVMDIVREQRADGIDLVTADHGDGLATCTNCGSDTLWVAADREGDCSVCTLAAWQEGELRGGFTSELLRHALDLEGRPRVLAAAVAVYWSACQEAFPLPRRG